MEQSASLSLPNTSLEATGFSTPNEDTDAPRLLIVDDDPAFSYLCTSFLEGAVSGPYYSVEVESIDAALMAMQSQTFDCVLTDYRLPDGNGVDLLEKIRSLQPGWLGATILMTAGGSEDIVADGMRAGADDYIAKHTITEQSLDRILRRVFEKVSLKRKLQKQNFELTSANSLLEKRNAEITDFYHKISHEIKTPLTAARMFMSMLEEGLAGSLSDEQAELVSQSIASCDELTKHFNELVECTRLETGKIKLSYSEELLSRLMARSVASLLAIADEKNVTLKINCDNSLPAIQVDAGRIVQVLANLIGNAIKFTESGGVVEVDACLQSDAENIIEISVSDTGIGIEESDIPKIFERLYQVNSIGDSTTGAGLGLGLSITKEIVALHGGSIEVQSTYGSGAVFTVKLPVSPAGKRLEEVPSR